MQREEVLTMISVVMEYKGIEKSIEIMVKDKEDFITYGISESAYNIMLNSLCESKKIFEKIFEEL